MMLKDTTDGKIVDVLCLKCKNKKSIVKVSIDGSEYGECTHCGNITYRKMSHSEKMRAEESYEERLNQESSNLYRNKTQRIREELASKPKNQFGITCPYCHSTNVEKITLGKKVRKGFFWGVAAASTLTKEWHCKNCKSNF